MRIRIGVCLALSCCLWSAASARADDCPLPGDVAPGVLEAGSHPPVWRVTGDGRVDIADVLAALRAVTGAQVLSHELQGAVACGLAGDVAPGARDESTTPATWRVQGDGRVTVEDVVILLRASIGLDRLVAEPPLASAQLEADGACELVEELRAEALESLDTLFDPDAYANYHYAMALNVARWGCTLPDFDHGGPETQGGGPVRGAEDYSTTNVQVPGVDEADFVKNDGSHVHVLANGYFQVLEAWPPEATHRISAVPIEGEPRQMFVHADRALVFSSLEPLHELGYGYGRGAAGGRPCTYGYDCDFTGDGRRLKITVLDLADRSAPRVVRELTFDGSLVSSRRIDDVVHVVMTSPESRLADVRPWPPELGPTVDWYGLCDEEGRFRYDEDEIHAMFAAHREASRLAIEEAAIEDFLPRVRDERWVDGRRFVTEGVVDDCGRMLVPRSGERGSYLSVVSLNMTAEEDIAATTVMSRPGAVYSSHQRLYVAVRPGPRASGGWSWGEPAPDSDPERSTIHAFEIGSDPPGSAYLGSGLVKGRALNQLAMDEHDGHLRIATTSGRLPSPAVHSTVTVLRPETGGLETVGILDRIAPSEDIRSVRFDGWRAFVVTFKKTDPLFALDLTEPADPRVLGELHVPGYSTYIHLLDQQHLLTIGYDAEEAGSFAWFQGIQLQVFDVSDMAAPSLLHREVIGARGSASEAALDHHAFNYCSTRGLLALPLTICEGGSSGGSYGTDMTFNGLMVYRVTTGEGFEPLGGIEHAVDDSRMHCQQWWSRAATPVKRSVFLEDWAFSIAEDLVQVARVDELERVVASVRLDGAERIATPPPVADRPTREPRP